MKKIYLAFSMICMAAVGVFAQGETCATAVTVSPGLYTADGPTSGGGAEGGCFTGATNSDWYKFTPICDGVMTVSMDFAANGNNDTRLEIFTGDCSNLTCVASDDNAGVLCNWCSVVSNFSVTGGTTYYIEMDDRWDNGQPVDWELEYTISGGITAPNANNQITSSIISWTPAVLPPDPNADTGWDVQWGLSGFQLGTGTIVNVDSSQQSFLNITGLQPETTYDYYIALEGTGCYVGPLSFTTLPLCPPPVNEMTTPSATSSLFDWDPGFTEAKWNVEYMTAGLPIGSGTASTVTTSSSLVTGLASCTEYHWYVQSVCENFNPAITSNWVGPISFMTDCVCPEPENLDASSNPNPFHYDLNWTAVGTETTWNVQYGPPNFLMGTGTTVTANSNPFTLTGLVPDTDYCYYVQAVCGSTPDSLSAWVGPFCFSTGTFCPAPNNLGATNISTNDFMMTWAPSGSANMWGVEWGPVGFTLGTGTAVTVNSNNVTITGLIPDTEYCYYVRALCGSTSDSASAWVGPYCVTTLAACPAPNNLDVFNITNTAATLDWQAGAGESNWNWQVGAPGFMPGTGAALDSGSASGTSSIYVTNLNTGAPYEFWVQADCGGTDGVSTWVGPYAFSTLLANDQACGAIELLVNGVVNLHTNFGATINGENAIKPPMQFNINSTSSWYGGNNTHPLSAPVWFRFKAPASGQVEVSTVNPITTAGIQTEIAVYETGNCAILSNFNLLAANTWDGPTTWTGSSNYYKGSKVLLCDLTPGQQYYIMVDNFKTTYTWDVDWDPGMFGISVTGITSSNSGTATPITVCADGSEFDLFDAIDNFGSTTGTWYNPSIVNPSFTTPGEESMISLAPGVYNFDYAIQTVCGSDTTSTTVTAVAPPMAGNDGSYSACNTEDIFLLNYLNGLAEFGGTWVDANGVHDVSDGIFHAYGVGFGTYNFHYIVAGNGVCDADTATVTVTLTSDCLGLDDPANSTLEVYPNPVNDVLTISNLNVEGNALVTVYDAQGKVVYRNDVTNNNNYTIDMTAFESGVYMVEVTSDNTSEKVRVIKQ